MKKNERGMTLVETLAALVLLGIGIMMSVSVVLWANKVEERAVRRAAALDLATGLAEQLRGMPYEDVREGAQDLAALPIPAELVDVMAVLEVETDDVLSLKHVRIVVTWHGPHEGLIALRTTLGDEELYR